MSRNNQSVYIPVGSVEETQALAELEQQIKNVELEYTTYAEKHLDVKQSVDEQKKELSKMSKLFCVALAGACLLPLRKGVNSKSVLRVIGLWAGCCFLSKTFRQETNRIVSDVMSPLMSKKAAAAKPGSMLAKRKLQIDESGGTLPLTPDSLAIAKIAFCKQAYRDMRVKGADVEGVLQNYQKASERLYQVGLENGVCPELVDKSMRKIVADLIDKDSTFIPVFTETAYDLVYRGEDKVHIQKYRDGEEIRERTYTQWEGAYLTEDGDTFVGGFSPRRPESVNELRRLSKCSWDKIMAPASTLDEWGTAVVSPAARQLQQRYMHCIAVDNHLTLDENFDLNAYMRPEDDVSWLLDIDGDDPFGVGSLDDELVDIIQRGPKPDANHVFLGVYPEFKSAYSKWLNHHPDLNPGMVQAKANEAYCEYVARGRTDDNLLREISDYVAMRKDLQHRWALIFDDLNEEIRKVEDARKARVMDIRREHRPLPQLDGVAMEF